MKRAKPKPSSPKRRSLSVKINLIFVGLLVAVATVGFYQTVKAIYASKQGDSLAIAYLELEARSNKLAQRLARARDAAQGGEPDLVLRLDGENLVPERGELRTPIPLRSLGLANLELDDETTVIAVAGRTYVAATKSGKLLLWKQPFDDLLSWPRDGKESVAYVLTKQAQLVFSSSAGLNAQAAEQRPLVQRFITAPVRQGQFALPPTGGDRLYGFFQEVPGTNMVLFQELGLPRLAAAVKAVASGYFVACLFVALAAMLLLQFPLQRLSNALFNTARAIAEFGQNTPPMPLPVSGTKEVDAIRESFFRYATVPTAREPAGDGKTSAPALAARDLTILSTERQAAVRSFLAAAEAAANWYEVDFAYADGPLTLVAAGVVSHGATEDIVGIVGTAYREVLRLRPHAAAPFDGQAFLTTLNSVLFALGRGKWIVNVQVITAGATEAYEADLAGFAALVATTTWPGLSLRQFAPLGVAADLSPAPPATAVPEIPPAAVTERG